MLLWQIIHRNSKIVNVFFLNFRPYNSPRPEIIYVTVYSHWVVNLLSVNKGFNRSLYILCAHSRVWMGSMLYKAFCLVYHGSRLNNRKHISQNCGFVFTNFKKMSRKLTKSSPDGMTTFISDDFAETISTARDSGLKYICSQLHQHFMSSFLWPFDKHLLGQTVIREKLSKYEKDASKMLKLTPGIHQFFRQKSSALCPKPKTTKLI